jgi:hypothetical protein
MIRFPFRGFYFFSSVRSKKYKEEVCMTVCIYFMYFYVRVYGYEGVSGYMCVGMRW